MQLLAQGQRGREMAAHLHISDMTLQTQLENAIATLGVSGWTYCCLARGDTRREGSVVPPCGGQQTDACICTSVQ